MAYKKTAACPEEIVRLIWLFNLLPKDVGELTKVSARLFQMGQENHFARQRIRDSRLEGGTAPSDWHSLNHALLNELVELIGRELAEELGFFEHHIFEEARTATRSLIDKKFDLLGILESYAGLDFNTPPEDLDYDNDFVYSATLYYEFNEDSTIRVKEFNMFEVLLRNEVPVARIKVCPECNDIYWATRKGAATCAKKTCSNAYHQRLNRRRKKLASLLEAHQNASNKLGRLRNQLGENSTNRLVRDQQEIVTDLEGEIAALKTQLSDSAN